MRKYRMLTKANVKLGDVWRTGTTAGGKERGGTCPFTCRGCYAIRGNFAFPHVAESLAKMAYGIRYEIDKVFEDFRDQLNRARKKPQTIRINHSGDFVGIHHILEWVFLAMDYPQIKFYFYTKRYDLVRQMLASIGELPSNMFMNVSVWGTLGINEWEEFKKYKNVNVFVVDLKPDNIQRLGGKFARCMSYPKPNGKMDKDHSCADCKLCFGGKDGHTSGLEIHCYKH